MFDQSWRALNENFYDPSFHGADWHAVRDKYRALVKHCRPQGRPLRPHQPHARRAERLAPGHLPATSAAPDQPTADLGLIFERRYRGPGLQIAEVLKRGPADRRGLKLHARRRRARHRRQAIDGKTDVAQMLNDKVGEAVALTVTADPANPKAQPPRRDARRQPRTPYVPADVRALGRAQNADRVAELSKGKLGYIHIPSMDEAGLMRFVRLLYSDNFDKEGIVLDVRYNGGGFTHDQVLNYLTGKEHTVFRHRQAAHGLVLRSSTANGPSRWSCSSTTAPTATPRSSRTPSARWGLGKLVGQPTGGHVIGTRDIRLIDGSNFRMPRIGVHTVKGVNMEKEGVVPDIEVSAHPDQLAHGVDPQLDRAVEVLLQDVVAWKKAHRAIAVNPAGGGGAAPVIAPAPPGPTPAVPPKE